MAELFRQLSWWAVVDIALMTVIIYRLLLLIRGTRAMQMVLGILIVVGSAFLISQLYPLTTVKWLMDKFYSSIIIIIVVLFQEEIRRVLSRMGKKPFYTAGENVSSNQIIDELCRTTTILSNMKIGALLVIERNIILTRYIDIGVLIEGRISNEILRAIFHPTSPIHDGAVIIQQGRIAAAGCYLPLTRDDSIDPNLGTRHRAAIGISQETDALVMVVSEENSLISFVVDGHMTRNLDAQSLRSLLKKHLSHADEQNNILIPSTNAPNYPRGVSSLIGKIGKGKMRPQR